MQYYLHLRICYNYLYKRTYAFLWRISDSRVKAKKGRYVRGKKSGSIGRHNAINSCARSEGAECSRRCVAIGKSCWRNARYMSDILLEWSDTRRVYTVTLVLLLNSKSVVSLAVIAWAMWTISFADGIRRLLNYCYRFLLFS